MLYMSLYFINRQHRQLAFVLHYAMRLCETQGLGWTLDLRPTAKPDVKQTAR